MLHYLFLASLFFSLCASENDNAVQSISTAQLEAIVTRAVKQEMGSSYLSKLLYTATAVGIGFGVWKACSYIASIETKKSFDRKISLHCNELTILKEQERKNIHSLNEKEVIFKQLERNLSRLENRAKVNLETEELLLAAAREHKQQLQNSNIEGQKEREEFTALLTDIRDNLDSFTKQTYQKLEVIDGNMKDLSKSTIDAMEKVESLELQCNKTHASINNIFNSVNSLTTVNNTTPTPHPIQQVQREY